MPLEHLLSALEREARAQADALLAEARATAAQIAREAEERLAQRRGAVLGARAAELRRAAAAALAEVRWNGRRAVLEARQRLLDRVFAAAHALFAGAVAGEAYGAALPAHLTEALRSVGDEPAVIRCPAALAPRVRAAVAGREQVTVDADPAARPGIVVVTRDGAIVVDNTLEGRLERLRLRLAIAVLARLGSPP